MLRDITIGQYYSADSVIHKLDPRTKILWTVFYMVILFIAESLLEYAAIVLFTIAVIYFSKVPIKFMIRGLKPIIILVIFTAILNLFMTPGEKEVLSLGALKITAEGIALAAKMAARIILLIMGSSLLMLTTTPTVLTGGLESLLSPLKKIGVPVSVFVMMMSIALRFIPTLLDETDKIMKAQASRGADFESGGPLKRVKAMLPVLVPLFVSAFSRAEELAVAMECRCYNCDGERTSYRKYCYKKRDFGAFMAAVFMCGVLVILKVVQ